MNVNEIIMNKRIERGVSRKELAEGLGVSESTIYRIETNPNLNPNNKLVKRIYDILRMNVTPPSALQGGIAGERPESGTGRASDGAQTAKGRVSGRTVCGCVSGEPDFIR